MMLSIFNNGSGLWILFVILLGWIGYWGWKTYKSHKRGYHKQMKDGRYVSVPPSLWGNNNLWIGVAGVVIIIVFIIWINADYR